MALGGEYWIFLKHLKYENTKDRDNLGKFADLNNCEPRSNWLRQHEAERDGIRPTERAVGLRTESCIRRHKAGSYVGLLELLGARAE